MAAPSSKFTHETSEPVRCAEFSPFPNSTELLAVGGDLRLSILCNERVVDDGEDRMVVTPVVDYTHGTRVDALAWSPAADASNICLCTAGGDGKLRFFRSSGTENQRVTFDNEHASFFSSCAFESTAGLQIAATGDDCVCRIFSTETKQEEHSFGLKTGGVKVMWSPDSDTELFVAEKGGLLRIYDTRMQMSARTLVCESPLLDADWSACDGNLVGAVARGSYHLWDLSTGRPTVVSGLAHTDLAGKPRWFRWSRTNKNAFATASSQHVIKVHDVTQLSSPRTFAQPNEARVSNLSWSASSGICISGGDTMLNYWLIYT